MAKVAHDRDSSLFAPAKWPHSDELYMIALQQRLTLTRRALKKTGDAVNHLFRPLLVITTLILVGCPRPIASVSGEALLFPDDGKDILVFDEMTLRERCTFGGRVVDIFDVTSTEGREFTLGHTSRDTWRLFPLADEFRVGIFLRHFHSRVPGCEFEQEFPTFEEFTPNTAPLPIELVSENCGVELDLLSTTNEQYLFSDGQIICGYWVSIGFADGTHLESIQNDLDTPSPFKEIPSVPCMPIDEWKIIRDQKKLGTCLGDF